MDKKIRIENNKIADILRREVQSKVNEDFEEESYIEERDINEISQKDLWWRNIDDIGYYDEWYKDFTQEELVYVILTSEI